MKEKSGWWLSARKEEIKKKKIDILIKFNVK